MKKRRILKKVYLTDTGETALSSKDLHKAVDEFVFEEKDGAKEWKIEHGLETTGVVCSIFDEFSRVVYPDNFTILNSNEVLIEFSTDQKGKAFLVGNLVE